MGIIIGAFGQMQYAILTYVVLFSLVPRPFDTSSFESKYITASGGVYTNKRRWEAGADATGNLVIDAINNNKSTQRRSIGEQSKDNL